MLPLLLQPIHGTVYTGGSTAALPRWKVSTILEALGASLQQRIEKTGKIGHCDPKEEEQTPRGTLEYPQLF